MKKSIWFVRLMVVLLLLAGCAPSVDQAKTQFCSDWQAVGAAIQNAKALDENSTVDEAKDAHQQIVQAWDKAKQSAAQLQDVQLEATEDAFNAMTNAVESIPSDATLGQANTVIQASVASFDTAYTAINTTVCTAR